ncbi:uncharacterized protein Sym isoform X1 [Bemisia tabaci]|uniref:uncharacterized protein Sym isoform X1 n=1 Tax=Bemisia tabaci TaxID=7038 RepID=UPI003B28DB76
MSTYSTIVEWLNEATTASSEYDKVEQLTKVRDLILRAEANQLDNFLDEMLAFQTDRSIEVRKFVVAFIEEACKKDKDIIPKIMINVLTLIHDPSVHVQKRVIQASSTIYRCALALIAESGQSNNDLQSLWNKLTNLKALIIDLVDSDNDGIRTHTVKFLETIILLQSYPDADAPKKPNDFSLEDIPLTLKVIRRRKLEEEANVVFDLLVKFHGSSHISSNNLMTCMGSLTNIAKSRPQYMGKVVAALETLHTNLPPTLFKTQVSSVRKHLKIQLLSLLKHPASVDFHGNITTLLTDLGATCNEVMKAYPSPEDLRKRMSMKRTQEIISNNGTGAPPKKMKIETTPVQEENSQPSTESTLDSMEAWILSRLTPQIAAELVAVSLTKLPEVMPPLFSATYTPIAAAGTPQQIKHVARLLATQISTAGLGTGQIELNKKQMLDMIFSSNHDSYDCSDTPKATSFHAALSASPPASLSPSSSLEIIPLPSPPVISLESSSPTSSISLPFSLSCSSLDGSLSPPASPPRLLSPALGRSSTLAVVSSETASKLPCLASDTTASAAQPCVSLSCSSTPAVISSETNSKIPCLASESTAALPRVSLPVPSVSLSTPFFSSVPSFPELPSTSQYSPSQLPAPSSEEKFEERDSEGGKSKKSSLSVSRSRLVSPSQPGLTISNSKPSPRKNTRLSSSPIPQNFSMKSQQSSSKSNSKDEKSKQRTARSCIFCEGDHICFECPYLSLPLDERLEVVRRADRCGNCLGRHQWWECRSAKGCKFCGGRHHSLLHPGYYIPSCVEKDPKPKTENGSQVSQLPLNPKAVANNSKSPLKNHISVSNSSSLVSKTKKTANLINEVSSSQPPCTSESLVATKTSASEAQVSLAHEVLSSKTSVSNPKIQVNASKTQVSHLMSKPSDTGSDIQTPASKTKISLSQKLSTSKSSVATMNQTSFSSPSVRLAPKSSASTISATKAADPLSQKACTSKLPVPAIEIQASIPKPRSTHTESSSSSEHQTIKQSKNLKYSQVSAGPVDPLKETHNNFCPANSSQPSSFSTQVEVTFAETPPIEMPFHSEPQNIFDSLIRTIKLQCANSPEHLIPASSTSQDTSSSHANISYLVNSTAPASIFTSPQTSVSASRACVSAERVSSLISVASTKPCETSLVYHHAHPSYPRLFEHTSLLSQVPSVTAHSLSTMSVAADSISVSAVTPQTMAPPIQVATQSEALPPVSQTPLMMLLSQVKADVPGVAPLTTKSSFSTQPSSSSTTSSNVSTLLTSTNSNPPLSSARVEPPVSSVHSLMDSSFTQPPPNIPSFRANLPPSEHAMYVPSTQPPSNLYSEPPVSRVHSLMDSSFTQPPPNIPSFRANLPPSEHAMYVPSTQPPSNLYSEPPVSRVHSLMDSSLTQPPPTTPSFRANLPPSEHAMYVPSIQPTSNLYSEPPVWRVHSLMDSSFTQPPPNIPSSRANLPPGESSEPAQASGAVAQNMMPCMQSNVIPQGFRYTPEVSSMTYAMTAPLTETLSSSPHGNSVPPRVPQFPVYRPDFSASLQSFAHSPFVQFVPFFVLPQQNIPSPHHSPLSSPTASDVSSSAPCLCTHCQIARGHQDHGGSQ